MKRILLPFISLFSATLLSGALLGLTPALANVDVDSLDVYFYLDTDFDTPIPATYLDLEQQKVFPYSENSFANGTRFLYSRSLTVSQNVGYANNALIPMVFVYPIKPDGTVDSKKLIGMPAHYFKLEAVDITAYDETVLRGEFNSLYQELSIVDENGISAQTNFETQAEILERHMNLLASNPSALPPVYEGQTANIRADEPSTSNSDEPAISDSDEPAISVDNNSSGGGAAPSSPPVAAPSAPSSTPPVARRTTPRENPPAARTAPRQNPPAARTSPRENPPAERPARPAYSAPRRMEVPPSLSGSASVDGSRSRVTRPNSDTAPSRTNRPEAPTSSSRNSMPTIPPRPAQPAATQSAQPATKPPAQPATTQPARPVAAPRAKTTPVTSTSTHSSQFYRINPRFENVIEVRPDEVIPQAIVQVVRDGEIKYVNRSLNIPKDQRLIPILDEKKITVAGETSTRRAFHRINERGQIILNSDKQPEIIYLPSSELVYTPVGRSEFVRLTDDAPLTLSTPFGGRQAPIAQPTARANNARTQNNDSAQDPAQARNRARQTPSALSSENPSSQTGRSQTPSADGSPTQQNTSAASRTSRQTQRPSGPSMAISECQNANFAAKLAPTGESCELVEIENFQLVKSQLLAGLKGNATAAQSVLMSSGIIAVDESTNICSKVDVSHEEYVDDSRAQAQIERYKTNMDNAYRELLRKIHSPRHGNIGVAVVAAPAASQHTYSCDRNQQSCRLSYDYDQTERIQLKHEFSNYSDDPLTQEQINVYGPTKEDKYLFVLKRGGQIVKSLVLQDDPGLILNGPTGLLIHDLKNFETTHRFSKLSEIQEAFNTDRIRESKNGHFISIETEFPNGQAVKESERLGTKAAYDLIRDIRTGKRFYEMHCRINALRRSQPLPTWNSSGSEGVN